MIGGGGAIFDNLSGQRAALKPFGQSAPQLAFAAHPLAGDHQEPNMTLSTRLRDKGGKGAFGLGQAEPVQIKPRLNRQCAARQTTARARHQGSLRWYVRAAGSARQGRFCRARLRPGFRVTFRIGFCCWCDAPTRRGSNMAVAAFACQRFGRSGQSLPCCRIGIIGRRACLLVPFTRHYPSISRPASPLIANSDWRYYGCPQKTKCQGWWSAAVNCLHPKRCRPDSWPI